MIFQKSFTVFESRKDTDSSQENVSALIRINLFVSANTLNFLMQTEISFKLITGWDFSAWRVYIFTGKSNLRMHTNFIIVLFICSCICKFISVQGDKYNFKKVAVGGKSFFQGKIETPADRSTKNMQQIAQQGYCLHEINYY